MPVMSRPYRAISQRSAERELNASRYADSDLRKELSNLDFDIARDLPHKRRSDVASLVDGDGRAPAVRMTELLVRPSLGGPRRTQASSER
jgi:hypothetical protein